MVLTRSMGAIAISVCSSLLAEPQSPFQTAQMTEARIAPAAVRLLNGKVLVTGGHTSRGIPNAVLASAELFDPTSGRFESTGSMSSPRTNHSAVLLSGGDVLVMDVPSTTSPPPDIYLASSGTFVPFSDLASHRSRAFGVTPLKDGTILFTGGRNQDDTTDRFDAELYDPRTAQFIPVGNMNAARAGHFAVLLQDGRVLIAGCRNCAANVAQSAELYDPVARTFQKTGDLLITPSAYGTPTLLANGDVLIPGVDELCCGRPADDMPSQLHVIQSQLYNAALGSFQWATPSWAAPIESTVTPLRDGRALIAGGGLIDDWVYTTDALTIFDPATQTYGTVGHLGEIRTEHAAVTLEDGRVAIIGGVGRYAHATNNVQIYAPPRVVGKQRSVVH